MRSYIYRFARQAWYVCLWPAARVKQGPWLDYGHRSLRREVIICCSSNPTVKQVFNFICTKYIRSSPFDQISSSDCDENIASVLTSPQKIEITAETSVDVDETDILAVVEALVITTCRLSHPCLQKVSLESVYNRVFKIENRIKKQIVVFLWRI